jgi:hypothetical protein
VADTVKAIHPEFGQYDRMLFGTNGFLLPRAFSIDEHSNFIKLENACLQIDNIQMRSVVPCSPIPLFQQWDGATVFGPYSIYVSDGYGDPEDQRDIQPSTFFMLMRNVDKQMQYLGGFSAFVVDRGIWKGISKATYDAFVHWCNESFMGKGDSPISKWIDKINLSASIKMDKHSDDQLVDALGIYQRATRMGHSIAVITPATEPKLPLLPPPQEVKPPVMIPLSGSCGTMDVIPQGAHVELVA